MENTEIWKDVQWYEWTYQVSSIGRIKSLERIRPGIVGWILKEKYLKRWTHYWYKTVYLYKSKWKNYMVHRLVAQAFLWLDINDFKMLVCHKNDIRNDNRVDNLFLWTAKDNSQDCLKKWRWADIRKKILQFNLNNEFIKEWESIKSASIFYWIKQESIWRCCRKEKWYKTAWWFIWNYYIYN